MIIDDFMFPDRVDVKINSETLWHPDLKAQVEGNKIILLNAELPIREGDEVRRIRPNGVVDEYTITDVSYEAATIDFPEMLTLRIQKRGGEGHRNVASISHTYNVSGPNARVNVNSIDHSKNVLIANESKIFEDLAAVIRANTDNERLKAEILHSVEEMKRAQGTDGFLPRYKSFMELIANHATIFAAVAPFVSNLTHMLGR